MRNKLLFVAAAVLGLLIYASVTMAVDGILQNANGTTKSISQALQTLTDADNTLTVGVNSKNQIITATLTGNRTITLSTTGAVSGDYFRIVRKGLGLFTLDVGGLKTIPSVTPAVVEVMYDGSAWQLVGYHLL